MNDYYSDHPRPRKKREASLKKKEKGHAYNARHVRISLANKASTSSSL